MNEHDHKHEPEKPAPVTREDAGSQALSDALRSSFLIVRLVMIVLVVIFLASGFFTVGPQEKAVILRFGKPVGEGEKALLGPGFHFALPAPIDEVVRIPITQIQTVTSTVGWYATTPEMEAMKAEPPPGPSLNPAIDGYLITGDANIIHARAALRYRITDPIRYQFDFSNASSLVVNALNEALIFSAAQYKVDDVLTRDVTGFRDKIYNRLLHLIDQQQLGITIEPPTVQVIPPRQEPVHSAFARVLDASIQRDKQMNESSRYELDLLGRARSSAASITNSATTERQRLVEFVAADAKRFSDFLPQYEQNPELYFRQMQTETLQRVLTNVQEKIFVPARADGKSRELRIQINREPQKPGANK